MSAGAAILRGPSNQEAFMAQVTRSQVLVAGAELSFLSAGPVRGDRVIFLHGIPAGAELWREVLRLMGEAGYRAYAPDLPGYGRTRLPPGGDHSLAGAAALLADWIRQEAMGRVWVVGHDLGGCVAQIMAVRDPDVVGRLTLSSSPVEDSWPVPIVNYLRRVARLGLYRPLAALRLPHLDPRLRRELRRAFANPATLEETDVRRRIFFDEKVTTAQGRRKFAAHAARLDSAQTVVVAPGLRRVRVPSLLLWGTDDRHVPWEKEGARLQQLLPHAEAVLLPDASHFSMLDRPEAFTEALLEWRRSEGVGE
jgi:pimeloyl-ACP methyl ester carboxylesterase